jgi:outer membrane protein OmpA-like peptidoglycan-associated protein
MTRRIAGLAVTASFAAALVLTNTSCAGLQPGGTAKHDATQVARPAPRQRLVQLFFGRDAAFGVCAEPACPAVTPKTLATTTARPVVHSAPAMEHSSAAPPVEAPPPPRAPEPQVAAPPATRHVIVGFPFGSSELTTDAGHALGAAIPFARVSDRIIISGRTDSIGDQKINEKLALARAIAVRNFIRDQVPDLPNIIAIDAKGRCCFIATNDTQSGRAQNRRVEVVFTSQGGA